MSFLQTIKDKLRPIKKMIFPPPKINFIDVGSVGELPMPWRNHSDKLNYILKFEPQEDSKNENKIISLDKALWSKAEQRKFYIYKGFDHSGSSLFEQNYSYVEENFDDLKKRGIKELAETWFDRSKLVKTEVIQCDTLDHILSEIKVKYDFIKIDAQGAEYEIIKGAESFLKSTCLGLHLELFNIPLYQDIKLLEEVKMHLDLIGFELVFTMPAHGSFNSQHDCIFLKRNPTIQQFKKIELIKRVYRL